MNRTLTHEELKASLHPVLPDPSEYRVVRYEVDIDFETSTVNQIAVVLRSRSGQVKHLRFHHPRIADFSPLSLPDLLIGQSIYVADVSSLGWDTRARIEVGSWAEDQSTFFWAERVEDVA